MFDIFHRKPDAPSPEIKELVAAAISADSLQENLAFKLMVKRAQATADFHAITGATASPQAHSFALGYIAAVRELTNFPQSITLDAQKYVEENIEPETSQTLARHGAPHTI